MLTLRRPFDRRSAIGRFLRSRRGSSAVEFALICPLLTLILGGTVEVAGGLAAANRATHVADTIGQLVSQAQRKLTADEVDGFLRSAALVDPDIVEYARQTGKSLEAAVNASVTSINFSKVDANCVSNCVYTSKVIFGRALAGPVQSCGPLKAGSVPTDFIKTGALVKTDVEVFFRPLMTTILGSEISFKRTTYFKPRYVQVVEMESGCP